MACAAGCDVRLALALLPLVRAQGPGRLFALANAQLPQLKDDGTVVDPARLKPIVILELPAS